MHGKKDASVMEHPKKRVEMKKLGSQHKFQTLILSTSATATHSIATIIGRR